MNTVAQLVGFVMLAVGAVWVTGSGWPAVAAGAALIVAVELPGLRSAVARRRQLRKLERQFAAGRDRAPTVLP